MKTILTLVLGGVLLTAIFVGSILFTETGLFLIKKTVNAVGSPFITIGNVKGKLSGEWSLYQLEMEIPGAAVNVDKVECRLQPAKLFAGELGIVKLVLKGSRITVKDEVTEDVSSDSFIALPKFFLPFGFAVESVRIEDLSIMEEDGGEIFVIERAGFRLSGKNDTLRLNSFFLKGSGFDLTLNGSLDFSDDWNLDILGGYRFSGAEFENLSGTFSLNGPLNNPSVELGLYQPAAIRATGSITDLLGNPELKVTVVGENVDLSSLSGMWPEIHLVVAEIQLSVDMNGYQGDIRAEANWGDLKNVHIVSSMSSNWDGIEFQSLSLTSEDSLAVARKSWISWTDTFRWGGDFSFENFNPAIFAEEFPGKIDAELSSKGKVVGDGVEASFEISRLEGTVHKQQITARGNVFLTENEVYTDGLQVTSGEFQGSALIQQGSFSWADTLSWSGDISFDDFDPSVFYPELPGQISGRIVGEGQQVEEGPEGSLTIRDLSGKLRGLPLNGKGYIEFRNGRLNTSGITVQHGSSNLQVKGTAGDQFALDFILLSPDISQIIPAAEGTLTVEGRLAGTLQDPELQFDLDAGELKYHEYSAVSLTGKFHGQPSSEGRFDGSLQGEGITVSGITLAGGSLEIAGSADKHQMLLEISSWYGALQMQATGEYNDKSWKGNLLEIVLSSSDYGIWEQAHSASLVAGIDGFKLSDLCLTHSEGQFCLDGEFIPVEEDILWQIKSSLSGGVLSWLNMWRVLPLVVSGRVTGQLEAEGDSREILSATVQIDLPEADFEVGETGGEFRHILLDDTRFTGTLADNRFRGAIHTSMINGSTLYMSAEIDNPGKFSVTPGQLFLTGEVDFERIDLDFLAPLTGYLLEPTGKINGSFLLSGTLNQPEASGELEIIEGGIAFPHQGITLENIKLALSTEENGVWLNCEASSGVGNLVAAGKVKYTDNGILGDLGIKGKDFMLLSLPEYEISISPDIRFVFSKEKGELSGGVMIPDARIVPEEMTSSVTVSSDVILVNGEEETRETIWPFSTNLDVQLGDDVRIDGYGLKGRLVGGLKVQDVPGSFLTATGGLDLIDSSFSIFGRSFDIERGRVLFTGGPVDNPGVDIRVQKKVSAEEAKGDGYVVGVDVNGLVQNLQFHLFSDPFMEDTDILSHLLVGRSLADSSEEESNILGAAVVALGLEGGTGILQTVGNLLPVDELHLEGSSEKEDVSLVIGKRITKDLYFGYDINMFSQLSVFRVRYGLTRGFSIETQTSTESTGTDILYTFER